MLRGRADAPNPTVPATGVPTGKEADVRLKQSRAPKIALQATLGAMAVGDIVTKELFGKGQVLQQEPYSIAGRALLVVDSDEGMVQAFTQAPGSH